METINLCEIKLKWSKLVQSVKGLYILVCKYQDIWFQIFFKEYYFVLEMSKPLFFTFENQNHIFLFKHDPNKKSWVLF